ncbi:MAG: hypothetical protein WD080_01545 [Egibacteraceae bacterium]
MDTFIIRLYTSDDIGAAPGLCGIVEHVRSGGETVFRNGTELLAALAAERAVPHPRPPGTAFGQD